MMTTIEVTTSGFKEPFLNLNGMRTIPVSKHRLMKFATSVGLPIQKAVARDPDHTAALAAYKALAIKCSVDFGSSKLGWPQQYVSMDPTEKANLSYWTGMTFAALMADEYLGVARLLHSSIIRNVPLARANRDSRRLADLVGQDAQGGWHVIEAKGRQRVGSKKELDNWKTQARTIASINGSKPVTESYAFTRIAQTFSVNLVDPPHITGPTLTVEEPEFVRQYYGPIVDYLTHTHVRIERESVSLILRLVGFDPVDVEFIFIGLTENAMTLVRDGVLPHREDPRNLDDTYIGSDGMVVLTSRRPDLQ